MMGSQGNNVSDEVSTCRPHNMYTGTADAPPQATRSRQGPRGSPSDSTAKVAECHPL